MRRKYRSRTDADEAYGPAESIAYAAVRTPVVSAALARVFRSIADAHPRAMPRSMVDFGAGHLPSYHAAKHVFGDGALTRRVFAVEPSRAMRQDAKYMLGVRPGNAKEGSPARDDAVFAARGVGVDENDGEYDDQRSVRSRSKAPRENFDYPVGVSFAPMLPPLSKMRYPEFELAVASYSLGELEDDHERDRIVRQLVSMLCPVRGGYLVVVEPGTPWGSAIVRRARRVALDHASALRSKHEGGAARCSAAAWPTSLESGGSVGGEEGSTTAKPPSEHNAATSDALIAGEMHQLGILSPEAQIKLKLALTELGPNMRATPPEMPLGAGNEGGGFQNLPRNAPVGATVIAPCFHAGSCPYGDATDETTADAARRKRGWCHFSQRVRRPALLRELKSHVPRTATFGMTARNMKLREARGHGKAAGTGSGPFGGAPQDLVDFRGAKRAARDYQDEKFSYVVIYREPMPGVAATDEGVATANDAKLAAAHRDAAEAAGFYDIERRSAQALDAGDGTSAKAIEANGDTAGPSVPEEAGPSVPEGADALSSGAPDELPEPPKTTAAAAAVDPDVLTAAYKSIRYDFMDSRFEDRPILGEEDVQDVLDRTLLETGVGQRMLLDAHAAVLASIRDADRKGSREWGRLVRPPLKRKGHVVVDACRPGLPTDAAFVAQQVWLAVRKKREDIIGQATQYVPPGQIERTIISKGKHGRSVYKWARDLKWGDAFPTRAVEMARAIQEELLDSCK